MSISTNHRLSDNLGGFVLYFHKEGILEIAPYLPAQFLGRVKISGAADDVLEKPTGLHNFHVIPLKNGSFPVIVLDETRTCVP